MRTKDLQIGTAYAIGKDHPRVLLTKAIVMAVRVPRHYRSGSYNMQVDPNGVKVEIVERHGKALDTPEYAVIRPATIVRPWSEHAMIQANRLDAAAIRKAARADRRERMERVVRIVEEVLDGPTTWMVDKYNADHIRLTLDEIETLIANLRPRN